MGRRSAIGADIVTGPWRQENAQLQRSCPELDRPQEYPPDKANAAVKNSLAGTNGTEPDLQGWLVMAFVGTERMAWAGVDC